MGPPQNRRFCGERRKEWSRAEASPSGGDAAGGISSDDVGPDPWIAVSGFAAYGYRIPLAGVWSGHSSSLPAFTDQTASPSLVSRPSSPVKKSAVNPTTWFTAESEEIPRPAQFSPQGGNGAVRGISELERATRLELATSTLARWRSTR